MELLKLTNINKSYRINNTETFQALKNINISFNKGELISIIGESGSGKSTLMNLIGGLDSHFDGELLFEGKNLHNFSKEELNKYRKNKIGFIFQSCNLIPHLSILENVTIALTLSNVKKEERIEKATKALAQVGLEKHINKKPNQLSGGQKQRVAIARAIANDPAIILADEPTGALDSKTGRLIMDIFHKLHKEQNKTIILITHSKEVASETERIITIKDGEIITEREECSC